MKRYCKLCGKPLSSYNPDNECFHHEEDRYSELLEIEAPSRPLIKLMKCEPDQGFPIFRY